MKTEYKALLLALAAGVCFWLLDSVLSFFFFQGGPFLDTLIFNVSHYHLVIRLLAILVAVTFAVVGSADAAKRRRAEEDRQRADRRYHEIVNGLEAIVWEADAQTLRFTFASRYAETLLGYPLLQWLSEPSFWADHLHPDDRDEVISLCKDQAQEGRSHSLEYRMIAANGSIVWLRDVCSVEFEEGKPVRLEGVMVDITERKKAEETLRRSEKHLRNVLDGLGPYMLVGLLTPEGTLIEANRPALEIAGLKPEDVLGKPFEQTYWWSYSQPVQQQLRDAVRRAARGEACRYDVLVRVGENRFITIDFCLRPLFDDAGNIIYLIPSAIDITERKKAEEARRVSESRFRRIYDSNMIGIAFWEMSGAISDANYAFLNMVGYTRQDLLSGKVNWLDMTPVEYARLDKKGLEDVKARGICFPFEKEYIRKDGTRVPIIIGGASLEGNDKVGVTYAIDITERKKVDEKISRQTAVLQAINDVFQKALTYETEEELGKTCLAVAEKLTASKFGFIGELNETGLFDTIAVSNPGWDACKMPGSDATRAIKNMKIRGIDRSALKDGKSRIVNDPASHPDHVATPAGHPPITCFLGVPLKQAGKSIGMIGLGNKEGGYTPADQEAVEALSVAIVEALRYKRAEERLQDYQQKLRELASKLDLSEERERRQIASDLHDGVGQDLALMKMQLNALRQSSPSAELDNGLERILGSVEKTIQTTRSLLFDLSPPVLYELGFESAVQWLAEKNQAQHGIPVTFQDDGQEKPLNEDLRIGLFRAVRELLVNVVKHAQAKSVTVSARRVGPNIEVQVQDDGVGFDVDKLQARRDLKAGFGLFKVRERLAHFGGNFQLDSQPSRGTRVTLLAPLDRQVQTCKGENHGHQGSIS